MNEEELKEKIEKMEKQLTRIEILVGMVWFFTLLSYVFWILFDIGLIPSS